MKASSLVISMEHKAILTTAYFLSFFHASSLSFNNASYAHISLRTVPLKFHKITIDLENLNLQGFFKIEFAGLQEL